MRYFAVRFSLLLLFAVAAFAAIPPQSPEELKKEATDVVVGRVLSVTSKLAPVDGGKDRVYQAQIRVEKVEKGKSVKSPSTITVGFRQTDQRPEGWAGPQGQNEVLVKGKTVRLYLTSSKGGYSLLEPNGWQAL